MPVNTREKRSSAQALLVPSFPPGVAPSTMDQAARQAAVWVYAGILATAVGGGTGSNLALRRLGRGGTVRPEMRDGREGVFIFDKPSVDSIALYKLLDILTEGQVLRAYRQPRRAAKRNLVSTAQLCARRSPERHRSGRAPERSV